MSRTDAHAPFRVRVARREVAVRAVHRCAGGVCDLPALVPDWSGWRVGLCHWEFFYTGTNVCSCGMCHRHRRPEVPRGAVKVELRSVAREWNGGRAGRLSVAVIR